MPCTDCDDTGFLLMLSSTHGPQVQRCDTCRRHETDEDALIALRKAIRSARKSLTQAQSWMEIETQGMRAREVRLVCPALAAVGRSLTRLGGPL